MPSAHDAAHLVALIGAAKAEADRLGVAAAGSAEHLAEALTAAEALAAAGGRADEGVRVDDLTTDIDK